MENYEKKLGRGLSALIGENRAGQKLRQTSAPNHESITILTLNIIVAGKYQPRQKFDSDKIEELSESIKESGVLQPIIVRKSSQDNRYEIIAGERRYRASQLAGLKTIPAIIKKLNNHQALELAIVENIQRSDLTIIEEAKSYQKLMVEFSYSQEQVAKKLGKSRSHVANSIRILKLPLNIQSLLNSDRFTMGHARAIINSNNQEHLANEIIENKLTVRDVEEIIREEKIKNNLTPSLPNIIKEQDEIKTINRNNINCFEEEIYKITGLKAKINYNSILNKGRVTLKFDDIEKLSRFIKLIQN